MYLLSLIQVVFQIFKMETFADRVQYWVQQIPPGRVASYGEIATLSGSPGAARAVGTQMKNNRNTDTPCHRVICSDGRLGGYNGNLGKKADLLRAEGVEVVGDRVKNFDRSPAPAVRSEG